MIVEIEEDAKFSVLCVATALIGLNKGQATVAIDFERSDDLKAAFAATGKAARTTHLVPETYRFKLERQSKIALFGKILWIFNKFVILHSSDKIYD